MRRLSLAVYGWLRGICGDDAYERYLKHHRAHHSSQPELSRRQFYLAQQLQRWQGVNRCC